MTREQIAEAHRLSRVFDDRASSTEGLGGLVAVFSGVFRDVIRILEA
jgi:hypothetical protein